MKNLFKMSNVVKIFIFVLLAILVFLPSNAFAVTTSTPRLSISKVADINVIINQGDKYALPATVKATMSNNSIQQVGVSWSVDTSNSDVNTYIFEGSVQGYSKKVKLTLTVKALPIAIASVQDINATVNQGDKYTLPSTVTATMSNKSTKQVAVTWNSSKADTSKIGNYTFEGTVQRYSKKVKLTLTVKALPITIASVQDINATVNQGDKYTLPSTVTATMSDKSTKQVAVTWNSSKVDTSKIGNYTFEGTMQGYNKKVKLTLTIQNNVIGLGKTVTVPNSLFGTYEITINNVELSSARNRFDNSNPAEVYKISYTYKLLAKGSSKYVGLFLYDPFKSIDSTGEAGYNYPNVTDNNPQELNIAGSRCTADTFIAVKNKTTSLTLLLDYYTNDGKSYITFQINV